MNPDTSRKVAHFVRKDTQFRASFIRNQITAHIQFQPTLIWRNSVSKLNDGGYADFNYSSYQIMDLSKDQEWKEKVLATVPKTLSASQINEIARFLDEQEVRLCHFHYGTDCGIFHPLLKKVKIPSVVSFYGYDAFSFPKKFFGLGKQFLNNRVFQQVNKVLAMTPEMEKDLIKAGCPEEKIIVHYHGVPSGIFEGIKSSYVQASDKFTLLIIAYFDPVKGHIFIFKALQKLISQGVTDIHLKIAGHGVYESNLRQFVKENNLDDYVSFLGVLKYGSCEMLQEIANSDIFIHPSVVTHDDKEGIPGAIVEAMFAGLPVISTFHGGIPYVIENEKTGLLVHEWDVVELSDAILKLKNDQQRREQLGIAGKKFAVQNLALEHREKNLEEIYLSLI